MKIAYIILAHDNPGHLNRLIKSLQSDGVSFYIHVNKRSDIRIFNIPKKANIHVHKNRLKIYWGGMSYCKTVINLLREAVTDNNDYYFLLTGTDYPIRTNNYIHNYLCNNNNFNFINIWKMPEHDRTFDRLEYFHFEQANGNNTILGFYFRILNFIIRKINIKRKFPKQYQHFILYGGCNFWCLSKNCIKYTLEFIKNNQIFVKFYDHSYIPDEMFFHTIIGNSPYLKKIKPSPVYSDWTSGTAHPSFITQKLLNKILSDNIIRDNRHILFIRKFNDTANEAINTINNKLLVNY